MKIVEWRGVRGLVYAPVLVDDADNFTTGTVKELAGVAEVSRTTESANEAHYYDNIPACVVSSTGADTININTSAIDDDVFAEITGQGYDENRGMMIERERTPGYWAIGYITKKTDGTEVYVWRLKGTFGVPDQTNDTENAGTDANGQTLVYTGIQTTHKFDFEGKGAKAINVDLSKGKADVSHFFDSVQTPDSVEPLVIVPGISVYPSTASVEEGKTIVLEATTTPRDAVVTWTSSDGTKASVTNGAVLGVAAGTATITAKITYNGVEYTDTCAVTVTEPEA